MVIKGVVNTGDPRVGLASATDSSSGVGSGDDGAGDGVGDEE
jgi:hypothetical protein